MLDGFSRVMTPAKIWPSLVSMFHAVKVGSNSALGSAMADSSSLAP
jgi:hypothetical protein